MGRFGPLWMHFWCLYKLFGGKGGSHFGWPWGVLVCVGGRGGGISGRLRDILGGLWVPACGGPCGRGRVNLAHIGSVILLTHKAGDS